MLRLIYISVLVVIVSTSFGQRKHWQNALACYQEDSLGCAQKEIDLAIQADSEKSLPYTWHLRAFIYRAVYKKLDKEAPNSSARPIAIEAFRRSFELDTVEEFKKNNTKGIEALAISFYNDGIRYLNKYQVEDAINSLEKHNITMRLVKPTYYNKEREIAIKRKAAVIQMDRYNDNKSANENSFGRAIEYFNDVLELDSNDFNANLNSGVLYHNMAVDLLMETKPELTILEVMELQEKHVDNMQRSLVYMTKAYNINPNHPGVIRALAGAYFSLHNEEKFEFYNQKLLKLEGSHPNE
jgi:regulator of RNase E activity RraB